MRWLPRTLALALCAPVAGVHAQSVQLVGMVGNGALLIVDGSAPKIVRPGASLGPVKVLSTAGDQAVVEMAGKRQTLRVGELPASVGGGSGSAGGKTISLAADSGGHFTSAGQINGKAANFMVDTGATSVAISMRDAQQMGLNFRSGPPVLMGTANGNIQAWRLRLDSVKLGDVVVYGVDAVVTPADMPYVLLGNSFLNRFQMKRENTSMTLDLR